MGHYVNNIIIDQLLQEEKQDERRYNKIQNKYLIYEVI